MLQIDKGNNSVWSYRYFILNKAPSGLFKEHAPGTVGFVKEEIAVTGSWLLKDISNESAYVYLRGLLCVTPEEELKSQSKSVKRICINKVREELEPLLTDVEWKARQDRNHQATRLVLPCLIDLLLAEGEFAKAKHRME